MSMAPRVDISDAVRLEPVDATGQATRVFFGEHHWIVVPLPLADLLAQRAADQDATCQNAD